MTREQLVLTDCLLSLGVHLGLFSRKASNTVWWRVRNRMARSEPGLGKLHERL